MVALGTCSLTSRHPPAAALVKAALMPTTPYNMIPLSSLIVLLLWISCASAKMVANTTKLPEGHFRSHYDDAVEWQCDTVMLMGVGTAMSANKYDKLSTEIVTGRSIVFIMMDFNPYNMVKLSAKKYARLANAVAKQITTLVPACIRPPAHGYIIGGHSAAGQAAIEALPSLLETVKPIAFFGLDPFNAKKASRRHNITIPAIYWGFAKTTCFVTAKNAAMFAYEHTSSHERVFFQVANTHTKITHCIFTDNGCGGCVCPSEKEDAWVRTAVGKTVSSFISAVITGEFSDQEFLLEDYVDVNVYVDGRTIQHVLRDYKEHDLRPAFA